MDTLLLKPDEAAAWLRVGRSKLYALLKSGDLPSVRIGGSIRVPVEALRRWIERQMPATEHGGAPAARLDDTTP